VTRDRLECRPGIAFQPRWPFWILHPQTAGRINSSSIQFGTLTTQGGTLKGIPAVVSARVRAKHVIVDE
jgi:hypothetical protein